MEDSEEVVEVRPKRVSKDFSDRPVKNAVLELIRQEMRKQVRKKIEENKE